MSTQAGTGDIEFFDSHPADVTFRATKGGTVVDNEQGQGSTGAGVSSFTKHYPNSLEGVSSGATAIQQAGFHFVYWYDTLNKVVLSYSPTYTPQRPASGWPAEWVIEATFAADIPEVYVITLDPNGGTAGGGGGSPGVVRLEVKRGTSFTLPKNGSENVQFTKAGCTFSGWNTHASPGAGNPSGSFVFSDGQVLDSTIEEATLELLDWSDLENPVLALYAQWTVAISYGASSGGTVSANNANVKATNGKSTETLNASSGVRTDDNNKVGPEGATATANVHYHFTGWTVSGSTKEITSSEAANTNLSSSVVTRLSRYTDANSSTADYHSLDFTASFAPNTYIFKYATNGGAGSLGTESITYGSGSSMTVASDGVTRDGYEFNGWNLASNGTSTSFAAGDTIDSSTINNLISQGVLSDSNNSTATLYAQWTKIPDPEPEPDPEPDPEPVVEPDPDPEPDPEPEPEPTPVKPTPAASNESAPTYTPPSYYQPIVESIAATEPEATTTTETTGEPKTDADGMLAEGEKGLLSADADGKKGDSESSGPVVVSEGSTMGAYGSGIDANDENNSVLDQLMTTEGMQEASTTVAAVAAVGALASLVGVGVSVAGAAMVGAATIGTASAIGLSTAADLAADLAAAGAAGAAGAGAAGAAGARSSGSTGSSGSGTTGSSGSGTGSGKAGGEAATEGAAAKRRRRSNDGKSSKQKQGKRR